MSALDPLANPAQRQQFLPGMMNWRGLWDVDAQYYPNDVVFSSVDQDTYLAGTAILGGTDPALTPAPSRWASVSGASDSNLGIVGTATSGAAGAVNTITLGGALSTFSTKAGAVYLFSTEVTIQGGTAGGSANFLVSVGGSLASLSHWETVPALGAGQNFSFSVSGIFSSSVDAAGLTATLVLGAGAVGAVYASPTIVRIA